MRSSVAGVVVFVCLAAAACERAPESPVSADLPADAAPVDPAASAGAADTAGEDHAGHGRPGEPAPLIVIMRQLNDDMLALTTALVTDDRDGVVRSAEAIANHAPIAQDDIERIRRELGPEMADFERIDEDVHEASIQLSEIATTGQMYEVVDRLAEVQRGCIACHTLYRTQLTPSGR